MTEQQQSRDGGVYINLGGVFALQGQYEKLRDAIRQSLRLAPDESAPYEDLVNTLLALQSFDEARQIIRQTQARKQDGYLLHSAF